MFLKRKLVFWLLVLPGVVLGVNVVGAAIEAVGFHGVGHVIVGIGLLVAALRLSGFYNEWITRPARRRKGETYGKRAS